MQKGSKRSFRGYKLSIRSLLNMPQESDGGSWTIEFQVIGVLVDVHDLRRRGIGLGDIAIGRRMSPIVVLL